MKDINKTLFCIFAFLTAFVSAASAATPQQIIDRAAAKLKAMPSVYVDYTLKADGNSVHGVLTICGERFTASAPGLSTWYDGKTQWTYSGRMGEVNIINPTQDEVEQINPFAILRSLGKNYKAAQASAPKGCQAVKLTSTYTASDIREVTVTISEASSLPTRLLISLSNRQTIDISVNHIERGESLPVTYFQYNPKQFPGVQVVDLR